MIVSVFHLVRSMDFGGSLYGEWELMRDARVRGFNLDTAQKFGNYTQALNDTISIARI